MKAIVAIEDIIKQEEKRVSTAKKQLAAYETGELKMSYLEKTSTENTLEESTASLEKHKEALAILMQQDLQELEEKEKLEESIKRKNYYKNQRVRIKRDKIHSSDIKLEAFHILDELSQNTQLEDSAIYDIAEISFKLNLTMHEELNKDLKEISDEFESLVSKIKEENIQDLQLLNVRIPIIILHFKVLYESIVQTIEDKELEPFSGFPKYEDWWIDELWKSHQAYFALYKWRKIISQLCITTEQKISWDILFSSWLFAKKIINGKGAQCFEYNYAFDKLLFKYAQLDEELDVTNLETMEEIIKKITSSEDFNTVTKDHKIVTKYLAYKKKIMENSSS